MKSNPFINTLLVLAIVLGAVALTSCNDEDDDAFAPKPRGYFKIELPEKQYQKYQGDCPFDFEFPIYSKLELDHSSIAEPCWINMEFPKFRATLHLSYRAVKNNLMNYLEDSRMLSSKHQVKASGINEQLIVRDSSKVYGLIFNVSGNAASALQFYLTDSTKNFVRGALYFNVAPNADSLAPVLDFLSKDVYHFIETFKWR